MKKIILIPVLLLSLAAISQVPGRVTGFTVRDARLKVSDNFIPPSYHDTTAANDNIGADSCGAIIFSRTDNALLFRECSPKRWVAIGGTATTPGFEAVLSEDPDITTDHTSDFGNNDWIFHNIERFAIYYDGGITRKLDLTGTEVFLSPDGTEGFKADYDTLRLIGMNRTVDTSKYKSVVVDPNTGGLAYAPWLYAGSGGGSPGGSDRSIQFNNSSAFDGSALFNWNSSNYLDIWSSISMVVGADAGLTTRTNAVNKTGGLYVPVYNSGTVAPFSVISGTGHSSGNFVLIGRGETAPSATHLRFYTASSTSTTTSTMRAEFTNSLVTFNSGNNNYDFTVHGDNNNNVLTVDASADGIGAGTATPTAKLHISAGSATAGTAPLKLTSGTNLTTPENGAIEYNGSHFYATPSDASRGVMQVVRNVISSAGTLTLANYTHYIYTGGSTATWTLPTAASGVNTMYYIKNRGSAALTVQATASASEIYTDGLLTEVPLAAGEGMIFASDGTYWNVWNY